MAPKSHRKQQSKSLVLGGIPEAVSSLLGCSIPSPCRSLTAVLRQELRPFSFLIWLFAADKNQKSKQAAMVSFEHLFMQQQQLFCIVILYAKATSELVSERLSRSIP